MNEIFVLNKEKNYELAKNYINQPSFFGYWNTLNPEYGGVDLLDTIKEIKFEDVKDLISKLDLKEFDYIFGSNKNIFKNILLI